MKKIFLLIIVVLLLCGCGTKNNQDNKLPDDTVVLQDITYKIDKDDEGYGLKYKVASNFRKSEQINNISYYSEDIDDRPYFVIRLFQYKNKSVDYVIKDIAPEYDDKQEQKINGLDYTIIHFINYTKADVYIYIHKQDNYTYAITFTANIDISRLEDIFIKNIEYPTSNY